MWDIVVAYLLVSWYFVLLGIGLLGWREARKRYTTRTRSPPPLLTEAQLEGVSILRPLCGLDPNMYENLETSFLQAYPTFEIIFAVADERDPCLAVVRDLLEKYPTVDARISLGEEIVGVNPKINNLMEAYRNAKYDLLWVIDSNVSMPPETLLRSVASFHPPSSSSSSARVGLVHHVPYALASERDSTLGTQLERAFLNTNHAKMYIALNTLAIDSCVMGKSNLFRRSDVDKINASMIPLSKQQQQLAAPSPSPSPHTEEVRGLAAVAKFAAEDSTIGTAIWHELGLAHVLSVDVAANALGPMGFTAYMSRRARWIRVRKGTVVAATLLEPFTESVFAGGLAVCALAYLTRRGHLGWGGAGSGGVNPWFAFLLHWAVFLTIDLDVRYVLTEKRFGTWREWAEFVGAWVARELLAFPIWLYAICGDEIDWRGEKYRMLKGGEVERVQRGVKGGWWTRVLGGRNRRQGYEPMLGDDHP